MFSLNSMGIGRAAARSRMVTIGIPREKDWARSEAAGASASLKMGLGGAKLARISENLKL